MSIPGHMQIDFGRYIAGVVGSQEEADFVLGLMHYVAHIGNSFSVRFVEADAEKLTGDRWEIVLETSTPTTQREETLLKRNLNEIGMFVFGASRAYRKLKEID